MDALGAGGRWGREGVGGQGVEGIDGEGSVARDQRRKIEGSRIGQRRGIGGEGSMGSAVRDRGRGGRRVVVEGWSSKGGGRGSRRMEGEVVDAPGGRRLGEGGGAFGERPKGGARVGDRRPQRASKGGRVEDGGSRCTRRGRRRVRGEAVGELEDRGRRGSGVGV